MVRAVSIPGSRPPSLQEKEARKRSLGHLGAGGRQGLGRTQPELCWSAGVGVSCSVHGGVPMARSLLPALWTLRGPQSPTPFPLRTASAYQTPNLTPTDGTYVIREEVSAAW